MKGGAVVLLTFAALVVLFTLPGLFIAELAGRPPRHCLYLKPVPHHPGVLKCSEKP